VKNMAKVSSRTVEVVRASLLELAEWVSENTQLKNYGEVRKFLYETLDITL